MGKNIESYGRGHFTCTHTFMCNSVIILMQRSFRKVFELELQKFEVKSCMESFCNRCGYPDVFIINGLHIDVQKRGWKVRYLFELFIKCISYRLGCA